MSKLTALDPEDRRQAVLKATKAMGPQAAAILIEALRDNDPIVREWAVEGIVRRKAAKKEAVESLVELLKSDRRADVRWYAARALGKLEVLNESVREALVGALDDKDDFVRCYAAWAIGKLRIRDQPVVAELRKRLLAVRKTSLEAHSLGVALAQIHTEPMSDRPAPPHQENLFGDLPAPDRLPTDRPKTKRDIIGQLGESVKGIDDARARGERRGSVVERFRDANGYAAKELAVAQRGESCQICNFRFRKRDGNAYYECHHIIPLSKGGGNADSNLLVLCANHHRELHYADVKWPHGTTEPSDVVINGESYPIRWK